MVEQATSWFRQNSTLIYFLIAQFIALGAGAASMLAYMVKLETRVFTMEHRGAEYTVSIIAEMKKRITVLEGDIEKNEENIRKNDERITRVIDVMTRELGKQTVPPR
jgi:exopolysaccharide biosynthesis protein